MAWQLSRDLNKYRIRACPLAGALAVVLRSNSDLQSSGKQLKNDLSIYSQSGQLLRQWRNLDESQDGRKLVELGWWTTISADNNAPERLCLLYDDATVHVYSLRGDFEHVSLGLGLGHLGILDARFYDGGMIVITGDFQLHSVDAEFKVKALFYSGLTSLPSAWAVLPPRSLGNLNAEALMSQGDFIYQIDGVEKKVVVECGASVTHMQVSPNGKLVAIFTLTGKLQAFSADFQNVLLEFPAKSKQAPKQLTWCGSDAISLAWDDILLLLGPYGNWVKYTFDEPTCLFSEMDSMRMISSERNEQLEKVPQSLEDVFNIGSTKPAALLYDASDAFDRKDPKADNTARSIRESMPEAVECLIEAAGREYSVTQQKSLMKAASFGKSFMGAFAAEPFVKMAQTIRVLNALRDYNVSLPFTYDQYKKLPSETILRRLIHRDQHLLAIKLCEYLKLNNRIVVLDWITQKLALSSASDDVLYDAILPKLGRGEQVLPIEVARIAFSAGRPTLSTLFLSNNKMSFDQIPLLLDMQENEVALSKAIASGDSDLVFLVIFNLKYRLPLGDFLRIINEHYAAMNLFEKYCRARDLDMLKSLFYQSDRRIDGAMHTLSIAWSTSSLAERKEIMDIALKQVSGHRDGVLVTKAIEEAQKLMTLQVQYETDTSQSFSGLTLSETIYKLIFLDKASKAQKLKNDFHIPDKRYWYLKIKALADIKDWDALEKFSKSKKPPVGYKAFVDQCMVNGNVLEAKKYILRCENHLRPQLFLKIGAAREAAQAAFANKDASYLRTIRQQVKNSVLQGEIDQWIHQLGMRED